MPRYFSGAAGGMARMRAAARASSAAGSGVLGAEQEASATTAAAIRPASEGFIESLAPHRPLTFEHGFQRRASFFGQMVGLLVSRVLMRRNVGPEGLYRPGNRRAQVGVPAHKLGGMPKSQIQQVVENQHLSIAVRARANADGRSLDFSRDHG